LRFRKLRVLVGTIGLILKESLKSFMEHDGFDRSATLAYYGFLSLIPLLLLVLIIASQILHSTETGAQTLDSIMARVLPMSHGMVVNEVAVLSRQRAWGVVMTVILLWSVTPLASAFRSAFQATFRPEKRIHFLKAKLFDILFVLVVLVLFIGIVAAQPFYSAVKGMFSQQKLSLLSRVVDIGLPFGISIIFLLAFYRVFSPVRLKFWHLLAGCVTAAVLLSVMNPLFTVILKFNPNYGFTFGSFKAIFLLFVWVYYAFALILFGTEVIANLNRREALLIRGLFTDRDRIPAGRRLMLDSFTTCWGKGQVIFEEGQDGREMFYILSGGVELTKAGRLVRALGKGEYFGEMAMLLNASRTMTATVAEEGTELVRVSQANLTTVLRDNPKVVFSTLQEMAARLKRTNELLEGKAAVAETTEARKG
jgi:membrane protein